MKRLVWIAALLLTACGTTISSQQMEQIRIVDSRDCPRMDQIIAQMYRQLDARGLTNRRLEDMTEEQRLYNARARIIIWNLRAGCNNPGWNL
jgi:hypothetical protein